MVSRGGDSSQKRDCCAQKVNQRAACFRLERRGWERPRRSRVSSDDVIVCCKHRRLSRLIDIAHDTRIRRDRAANVRARRCRLSSVSKTCWHWLGCLVKEIVSRCTSVAEKIASSSGVNYDYSWSLATVDQTPPSVVLVTRRWRPVCPSWRLTMDRTE